MELIPDKGNINDRIIYSIEYLGENDLVLPKYVARIEFKESMTRAFNILNDMSDERYNFIHAEYDKENTELKIYHKNLIELKILLDDFIIRYLGLERINVYSYSVIKEAFNRITDIMWDNHILISELKTSSIITFDKFILSINSDLFTSTGNLETYDIDNETVLVHISNTINKLINDYSVDSLHINLIDESEREDTLREVYHYVASLYNYVLENTKEV